MITDFVNLWFAALDNRRAEVMVGMCDEDVAIRPFRARQEGSETAYVGHDGVRGWVESLDDATKIVLELNTVTITGSETAMVDADVWFERDGGRSGGPTVSNWIFRDGKLLGAVGYGSRADALAATS